MKAIRIYEFGGPEVMQIVDVERPAPAADEILVKVYAASVNPADYIIRQGGNDLLKPFLKLPLGLGLDAAGVVEETGSAVSTFKKGDKVYGVTALLNGSYTEYLAAKAGQFALMPKTTNFNEAASLPACARMAWNGMIDLAKIQPGQRVFIHGAAGGIGNLAVQIAKAKGANIIGTASAGNFDFLKSLGADELIDYNKQRFEEILSDIDVVFNAAPTYDSELRPRFVKVLKEGGVFVDCHVAMPFSEEFKQTLAEKKLTASLIGMGMLDHTACLTSVASLVDEGGIKVIVSKVYPWEQAAEAHRACETKHVRGKIVLEIRKRNVTL